MLIGLSGFKGSGKDTVGQYLVEHHDFVRVAFADKLKEAAAALFDIEPSLWDDLKDHEEMCVAVYDEEVGDLFSKMTVRELLMRFGKEMGRQVFGENFWVNLVEQEVESHNRVVITDVRLLNEYKFVSHYGGFNVRIHRPGLEEGTHESEQEPDPSLIDLSIFNNQDLENLYYETEQVVKSVRARLSAGMPNN